MRKFVCVCAIGLGLIAPSRATVLSDLAASMKAGDWAKLPCIGFNYNLLWAGESYHYITQYSDDAIWNPATRQVLYIGGGHQGVGKFITYTASTNTWQEETRQPWMQPLGHGYDHNALEVGKQFLYHRAMATRTIIWYYNLTAKIWRSLTIPASVITFENLDCCVGFDYFPEMQSLVLANNRTGSLIILNTSTWKWSTIGSCPMGYANFARYNPVHKMVWFGGGVSTGGSNLYRLDSLGQVTKLSAPPFSLTMGPSVQAMDPVSGKYLVFGSNSQWYVYDMMADSWALQNTTPPFFSVGPDGPVFGTVATPIPDYGVVMFCTYAGDNSTVYLYKHSPFNGVQRSPLPSLPSRLAASPNPFNHSVVLRCGGFAPDVPAIRLCVYSTSGRLVDEMKADGASLRAGLSWRPPQGLSNGIYIVKADAGKRSLSLNIMLER